MKARGVDFVLYEVGDLDRSVAFYRDMLGLQLVEYLASIGWAEFDVPPTTLALFRPEVEPKTGGASLWLAVEDLPGAVTELRTQGVPIVMDATEFEPCWNASISDPDGNTVGLHQRKDGSFG